MTQNPVLSSAITLPSPSRQQANDSRAVIEDATKLLNANLGKVGKRQRLDMVFTDRSLKKLTFTWFISRL